MNLVLARGQQWNSPRLVLGEHSGLAHLLVNRVEDLDDLIRRLLGPDDLDELHDGDGWGQLPCAFLTAHG